LWGLIILGVVIAWSAISLTLAALPLRDGRASLQQARRSLQEGDLEAAAAAFTDGAASFDGAASAAGGGPAFLPVIGNHHDALRAIADGGRELADAGTLLVQGIEQVPGGIDGLAPTDGGLPLDAYTSLQASVAEAAARAEGAASTIATAPTSYLVGAVADARFDAETETETLADGLAAAAGLLEGLPAFAGGDGPTRYLVLSANPAEGRGTGGIWGAYAILTFRDGEASLSGAAPTNALPDVTADQIEGIDPVYRELYDGFGGAASWQNMNMTPDFPSAARAALANLAAGGGPEVDGVISADPMALRELLRVTGSVSVPGTPNRVTADNVVDFTTNEAYAVFSGSQQRKEVLGAVAADVLEKFLEMQGKAVPRIRALATAVAGGNLQVFSTDPGFQSALEDADAAGLFARTEGEDALAVTVNNGSGNKVDFYARRTVDATVHLGGDHESSGTMEVSIENGAPTAGMPPYVLGPFVEGLGPGDASPLISIWCPDPCELIGARRDGAETLVNEGTERGMTFFRDYRPIPAGDSASFAVDWHADDVWVGDAWDGAYRLTFDGQPTIIPTTATITVVAPPGSAITWASDGMTIDGDRATWVGAPDAETVLEVRFRAGILTRWWRGLTG
jgi:hypothetical protein